MQGQSQRFVHSAVIRARTARALRGTRRHGLTSMIAMMYLVLASTLALGFYAMTTTSSQLSHNDEAAARAQLAAESGMDFMRRQVAKVKIPANIPPDQSINVYYPALQTLLNGSSNLGSLTISRSGNVVKVPSSGTIKLDTAGTARFAATITDWGSDIVIKVDGYYGAESIERSVSMDFTRQARTSSIFDFAVASKGQVLMSKGTVTSTPGVDPKIASVFSALDTGTSIKVSGGTIGGDLTIMDTAAVDVSGGNVGQSSITSTILADHVHMTNNPPEFPVIDPLIYKQYAVNTYSSKSKTQQNVIVKAGTNPTFNANDQVDGIMYIESPNQVTFNGNFKLNGFIVMASSASTTDSLSFKGNLTMGTIPSGSAFNAVRAVAGVAILAPNAAMAMTGSSGGAVRGNIIVKSFDFAGAADLQIDLGTLMTLHSGASSANFHGAKSIRFSATGATNLPSQGISYSNYYTAKPQTYQEITP